MISSFLIGCLPETLLGNQASILLNGSFESGGVVTGSGAAGSITSVDQWNSTGSVFGYVGDSQQYLPTHQDRLLVFNGGSDTFTGTVSQAIATQPGEIYTIQLDVGIFTNGVANLNQRLEIIAQGNTNLRTRLITRTSVASQGSVVAQWMPVQFNFTADSEITTLTLKDAGLQLIATANSDLLVDNVRVFATGTNSPPIAADDAFDAQSNTSLTISEPGVLLNDEDPDGLALTAIKQTDPSNGILNLSANGSFTYTPMPGFTGVDSFDYQASDGVTQSETRTVTLTVSTGPSGQVANGSFEYGGPANGSFFNIADWSPVGSVTAYRSDAAYSAPHGTRIAVFNPASNLYNGALTQLVDTVPGRAYVLTYHAGIVGPRGTTQRLLLSITNSGGSPEIATQQIFLGGPDKWIPKSHTFVASSTTTRLNFADGSGNLPPGQTAAFSDLTLDHVAVSRIENTHSLTITSSQPTGTGVFLSPVDIAGNGNGTTPLLRTYPAQSLVTLSASSSSEGKAFYLWRLNGSAISTDPTTTITLNRDHVAEAVYESNGYEVWRQTSGAIGGPEADGDGDSISNAVEFLVGGNPASGGDHTLLPTAKTITADPDGDMVSHNYLEFTYRRSDEAWNDRHTAHWVEWNQGLLGPWTKADPSDGVITVDSPHAAGDEIDVVKVYIPTSLAPGNRLFARLRITVQIP